MSTTDHIADLALPRSIELSIGGMTCASCAARIEKKLNKLDGVSATVNYATEKAKISYPDSVEPADLIATVAATGYTATAPTTTSHEPDADADAVQTAPDETAALRTRLLVSLVLTVPVITLSMIPILQFTNWQWLA